MRKINEVLRLKWEHGLSHRAIATSCKISPGTVSDYVHRSKLAGLGWPLPADMTESGLEARLFPISLPVPAGVRPLPNWDEVDRELKRKGVTLTLLWEEYREVHPTGYGRSRFCELYQEWMGTSAPSMHQVYKAGEMLFVDYAGQTMPLVDRTSGEVHEAQIFVATLGASNYTFAEATLSQSLPDWTASHVRAFEYFGGIPELLVPDNLKSGVKSACFYEPDLNPTYLELAHHYGLAIVPARVRHPRDKPKVENGVQQVEQRVLAPLRNLTFFELADLNVAVAEHLDALNRRPCQGRNTTRLELFNTIDKPALRPLPPQPYEFALSAKTRVSESYHIMADNHWYSVPYPLFKQEVYVRLTSRIVEVFFRGERIASHIRSNVTYGYTTQRAHMPPGHRHWSLLLEWTPEHLIKWAGRTGPATVSATEALLASGMHREQILRAYLGIESLGKEFGVDRLEGACRRALAAQTVSYRSLKAILDNNLDKEPLPEAPLQTTPIHHPNIRGADYYTRAEGTP
jgi:transposase